MKKLLLMIISALCFCAYAADVTIAENGKAAADIVIPAKPKHQVRLAASELKYYLDKITGADFKITSKPSKKVNFYLGMGDASKFKNQEFMINVKGDRIELYGIDSDRKITWFNLFYDNNQKGTLTAVYNFLDSLGVRWLAPGEQNTYVPQKKTLRIPEVTRRILPHYPDRMITEAWNFIQVNHDAKEYVRSTDDLFKWGVRNNNSPRTIVLGCHSERSLKLPQHPEWKKHPSAHLLSATGKRNPNYSCWTDPFTKEIWMRAVDGYFSGKTPAEAGFPNLRPYLDSKWPVPWFNPDEFMIDPMDHSDKEDGRCRCQRCQDTRKKLGCPPGDDTEILWNFIADIANYVNKKYPGKYISTLVYPPKHLMPKTVKLPKNIRVRICLPGARNVAMPEKLADDMNKIKVWSDHCGRENTPLWVYQCINFGRYLPGIPDSYPRLTAKYLQKLKPLTAGMYHENHNMSHTYRNLDVYIFMRMSFDPDRDIEKELADYHRLYYGPAAKTSQELFDYFEKQWIKLDTALGGKKPTVVGLAGSNSRDKARKFAWGEIYDQKAIAYIDSLITRMEKETANDPVYNKRAKMLRKYLFNIMKAERSEVMDKEDIRRTLKVNVSRTDSKSFPSQAEWDKVASHKLISAVRMKPEFKAATSFKVLAGKDNLYFVIDADEPLLNVSRTNKTHKNGHENVWKDNCVQLFFYSTATNKYWQFIVNDNNVWSSLTKGRVFIKWTQMPGVNIRSYKTAKGFRAEISIPLKQLGSNLRFNIARERNVAKDPTEYTTWSPLAMLGNWQLPDNYGDLIIK